jgi:hypothetical protein
MTQVPSENKVRPILFSAPMVLSILDGRKTQTRRVVHLPRWAEPCNEDHEFELDGNPPWPHAIARKTGCLSAIDCPYGDAGDFLWVREAHAIVGSVDPGWVLYRASGYENECRRHKFDNPPPESSIRWRPSIHMHRWASRIDLQVTIVRCERLHDISETDILAEGVTVDRVAKWCNTPWSSMPTLHHAWQVLWEHINGRESWAANPWVWATAFKRVETVRAAA